MKIIVVAAVAENLVISQGERVPWKLPSDLKRFRDLTIGHPVIMGRNTFDSIPLKFRPLPGRTNIVLTRQINWRAEGVMVSQTIDQALNLARQSPGADRVFIIGGGQLYKLALPLANELILTRVFATINGDTFFPEIDPSLWRLTEVSAWKKSAEDEYPSKVCIYHRD